MNSPIKKRTNPFAKPINSSEEEVKEEKKQEVVQEQPKVEPKKVEIPEVVEEVEETEEEQEYEYVQPVRQVTKPVAKKPTRQQYIQPAEETREKFTSTMDVQLRRRIKIVCATRGIMFSEFIEQACIEKLKKEA